MGCCPSLDSIGISTEKHTYLNDFYHCNVYANQGYYRRRMEDTNTVCLSIPNHPQYSLFGIFDGFNGGQASHFLSQNILNMLDDLNDLTDDRFIIDAINKMDKQWLLQNASQVDDNWLEANKSGTTFVFAIIKVNIIKTDSNTEPEFEIKNVQFIPTKMQTHLASTAIKSVYQSVATNVSSECAFPTVNEYHVRVFWAGDCRAVRMGKDYNSFTGLTVDHHCNLEKEIKRIENANGMITNNRIDGIVEVSRCFGCQSMKNNKDLSQNEQKMIAMAECKHIVCKQNEILLLFCDGLLAPNWNNETIVENYNRLSEQHKNEKNLNLNCLVYLTEGAMDADSRDNITTISVQFK